MIISNQELSTKMSVTKLVLSALFIIVFLESADAQRNAVKLIAAADADQIHFTIISGTAVTFDWVGTADQIRYGTDPDKLDSVVSAVHPSFLPVTSPWISDPGPYWEARLTRLQQNTLYWYVIGSLGTVNTFRTPPLPGKAEFRVCSTSDMHSNGPESVAMFAQIAGLKPDLVVTTGDLTGAGPDGQLNVVTRFHDAMVWSQSAAWMPAWGNHDWEYTTVDDLRTTKGRFDIPNPGTIATSPAASSGGEDWGWFDYGNTRFISCPEPWVSSSSRNEWKTQVIPVFTNAQGDPNIKFIVTFGHRSAYTNARGRSPGESSLKSILDAFHLAYPKYKLDLSGHNHQYERYQLPGGMTHIVNSTLGSYYRGWDSPTKPENCAFRAIHYGILVLDFSEGEIKGQFICSVGTIRTSSDYLPREENVCSTPGAVIDAFTISGSDNTTAVRQTRDQMPDEFSISNYPNPFNPSTKITYNVPQTGPVRIEIHDMLGRTVATLIDGVKEKGNHTIDWLAEDGKAHALSSGMYVARLQSGTTVRSTKMMLLR
jgi:predicted MPP superfamily phosphohydrolase